MFGLNKSLLAVFFCFSSLTIAAKQTALGEASLDILRQSGVITVSDFVRKNKTMNIKDVAGICALPRQINMYGREHDIMDKVLAINGLDKEYFINIGFVNIDCGDTNFIIDAMERDTVTFKKWLDYGFDLNRPVQYKGKVGTPIDIGFYMLNSVLQNENGLWRKNISYLKRRGFKSCKELGIKCSIDY